MAKILVVAGSQDEKPMRGITDPEFEPYFHNTLAPDLMAVSFSIESIRARLEVEGHPAEVELRQIENRISEILTQLRAFLSEKR